MGIRIRPMQSYVAEQTAAGKRNYYIQYVSEYRDQIRNVSDIIEGMEDSLRIVGATDIFVEMQCTQSQIRKDGLLKANARRIGPAVQVFFFVGGKRNVVCCDESVNWYSNLVHCHQILHRWCEKEYWQKNSQINPEHKSDGMEAVIWLCCYLPGLPPTPWTEQQKTLIRKKAVVAFHPDKHGGKDELWKQWEKYAKLLGIML